MPRFLALAAAAVTALAAAPTFATTNAVANGSFEDLGDFNLGSRNWGFFSEIPGWTGAPNGEIQSARTIRQVDAQDGAYYVELDSNENTTIYQDVSLFAATYTLSFFYSPRVNDARQGTNDMAFSVAGLLDEQLQGAPSEAFPYRSWTEVTRDFIVETAGTYRLSFSGAGAQNERNGCGDCGALIDNVSLTARITDSAPDLAPVPLPAAGWLMLAGIGGLGAARLRRKARAQG